jgi:hypothetical protein
MLSCLQESVVLRYLLCAAGDITTSDVDLAAASSGMVVGFNLNPDEAVLSHAKRLGELCFRVQGFGVHMFSAVAAVGVVQPCVLRLWRDQSRAVLIRPGCLFLFVTCYFVVTFCRCDDQHVQGDLQPDR